MTTADSIENPNGTAYRLNRFLLLAWLLTLPFGAWLLPLSLGSFTIYPNLVLTVLLSGFALLTVRRWNRFTWIYFAFCSLWFLAALGFAWRSGFDTWAKFDLRSLFLQAGFFLVLVNAYYSFPPKELFRWLNRGLHVYLVLLLAFGLFESFTGIHIQGTFTGKLLNLPISALHYMPVFIYDNPNDYLCYCLFFYVLCTAFNAAYYRDKPGLKIGLLLLLYYFAFLGDGNFAKLLILVLLVYELLLVVKNTLRLKSVQSAWYYIAGVVLLGIVLSQQNFHLGPKLGDSYIYRLNGIKILEQREKGAKLLEAKTMFTPKEQEKLMLELDRWERENPEGSQNIRKNLIFNGIAFIKEQPLLGIGPGAYQNRHLQHKVANFAGTLTTPHNFPIEIISQFGIFAWAYFGFLLWFFIRFVKRFLADKTRENFAPLLIFGALPFLWMMPSAYLYLDLHWLLVPLLFILLVLPKTGTDVGN